MGVMFLKGSSAHMSNDTSIVNKQVSGSKYTFFEAFIVVLFIASQSTDSSLLNIILGLSIFYYIREKLDFLITKIESSSNNKVKT
jgi:hypothetical protein